MGSYHCPTTNPHPHQPGGGNRQNIWAFFFEIVFGICVWFSFLVVSVLQHGGNPTCMYFIKWEPMIGRPKSNHYFLENVSNAICELCGCLETMCGIRNFNRDPFDDYRIFQNGQPAVLPFQILMMIKC